MPAAEPPAPEGPPSLESRAHPASLRIVVCPADPADPAVVALIRLHIEQMHVHTPGDFVFALDSSGLAAPNVSLFGGWVGDELAGMGALKQLDGAHGELKSMRTAPAHARKGVAQAILDQLIATARDRGYTRVSLETGVGPAFAAALALYERNGFVVTGPFAGYAASDHNRFLTLPLG